MAAKEEKKTKQKGTEQIESGKIYISATFNNTLVTVTDMQDRVLAWSSSGRMGFKGTRKSTPYAATSAVEGVLKKVSKDYNLKNVQVYIKGPGPGRDAALRAIRSSGVRMEQIADVTPMPYNGPRAKKKRRA